MSDLVAFGPTGSALAGDEVADGRLRDSRAATVRQVLVGQSAVGEVLLEYLALDPHVEPPGAVVLRCPERRRSLSVGQHSQQCRRPRLREQAVFRDLTWADVSCSGGRCRRRVYARGSQGRLRTRRIKT